MNMNGMRLILFKSAWLIFWLLFFLFEQVILDKDRFWLALLSPVMEGEARIVELSKEKRMSDYYYTIKISGIGVTPDFAVVDQWAYEHYDLDKIYTILTTVEKNAIIKAHWKKPWLGDAFYISIQGHKEITEADSFFNTLWWLFLSVVPLFMVFVAFRYNIFN